VAEEAPFTESELAAARSQMRIRDFAEAMTRFAEAWQESVRQDLARFAAAQKRAEVERRKRQKRVNAAEAWLREQAGAEAQTTFIGPTT
jgi:hypothetical protein